MTKRIADCHLHCRGLDYRAIATMLDLVATCGVRDACLLALPYRGVAENLAVLYAKNTYRRLGLRAFGGLHVTDRYAVVPPLEQAKELLALGCDGIKLMLSPDLQKYTGHALCDPYYEPLLSFLEVHGVPVNIHLADPLSSFAGDGEWARGYPTWGQMHEEAYRMLERHPGLRVCFAHFMFLSHDVEEAARVMDAYPSIYFDLAPNTEMYLDFDRDITGWHDFFVRYRDRVLFGTDCNAVKLNNYELAQFVYRKLTEGYEPYTQFAYREVTTRGLALDEETVDRIAYQSFFRFIGDTPREVDVERHRARCRLVLQELKAPDAAYVRGAELIPALGQDPNQDVSRRALARALYGERM